MSYDSPIENFAWASDEGFPFELWSDTDHTLAKHYGALRPNDPDHAKRITVLLDENAKVIERFDPVNIPTHAADVLKAIK